MIRRRALAAFAVAVSLLGGCTVASPQSVPTALVAASAGPSAATSPTTAASALSTEPTAAPGVAVGRPIEKGRVLVPRLGIDLPLAWGDIGRDVPRTDFEGATPERAAFVFPGSALPGAAGNTYIYAHARTGMFLTLWNARPGDLVLLSWPNASLRYQISEVHPRVDANDATWLDPSGSPRLTLQTSTGPRAADPRFIAIATPLAAN